MSLEFHTVVMWHIVPIAIVGVADDVLDVSLEIGRPMIVMCRRGCLEDDWWKRVM